MIKSNKNMCSFQTNGRIMTRFWPDGQLIKVESDAANTPLAFTWQRRKHQVESIANRWRIHTRWWEPNEMVWREYWKVATNTGLLVILFHDFLTDRWYVQRLYD